MITHSAARPTPSRTRAPFLSALARTARRPGDTLAIHYTPAVDRFGRHMTITIVVRASLTSAARIVALMAQDLRELKAAAGGVTHDDLVLRGWKASQIAEYLTAALARARLAAGEDA